MRAVARLQLNAFKLVKYQVSRLELKDSIEGVRRKSKGSKFQIFGAADEKIQAPNYVFVRG
jgi:hypothetical protein